MNRADHRANDDGAEYKGSLVAACDQLVRLYREFLMDGGPAIQREDGYMPPDARRRAWEDQEATWLRIRRLADRIAHIRATDEAGMSAKRKAIVEVGSLMPEHTEIVDVLRTSYDRDLESASASLVALRALSPSARWPNFFSRKPRIKEVTDA